MIERENVISLERKVFETIERTDHLMSLVPPDRLDWRPELPHAQQVTNDLGHLLGHLLDCLAGFCAVFHAAYPSELADFASLRALPVNQSCFPEEARTQMKLYADHIGRGFRHCTDADLSRRIPTVFVAKGETLLTLLLGNLEHLINHKYQLFFYLKLTGAPVSSRDVYAWRGSSEMQSLT
jgi:hypothetical protein